MPMLYLLGSASVLVCSSAGVVSLSVYRHLLLQNGAKLMAKTSRSAGLGLAKCCIVCLVVFAWSRVHL